MWLQRLKQARRCLVVGTAMCYLGTFLLFFGAFAPWWVVLHGDTSSLEGGQLFNANFGVFAVCENVVSPTQREQCTLETQSVVAVYSRLREVNNFHDRIPCVDRSQTNASPYFQAAGFCLACSVILASVGCVFSTCTTFLRPADVAVFAVKAKWQKRTLFNPLAVLCSLWGSMVFLVACLSVMVFFFDSWIGCNVLFCDVCRYSLDCSCSYGASLSLVVIGIVMLFVSGCIFGVRWFQLHGGSSSECPCPE